jgi:hypothetical protein
VEFDEEDRADAAMTDAWASIRASTHDLIAARTHGLLDALTTAQVMVLADCGYQGARGTVRVPFRGRHLPAGPTARSTPAHARLRAPGERAVATVKNWRLLRKIRCCPQRASVLVAAVLTLHAASRP